MIRREKTQAFLCLAVVSAIMIALCSMSSPLYPINIWDDANCLLTVGRAMKSGAVLYRDIYEQKGPVLYFAHMLAACISDSRFFGVYLMETVCFSIFLYAAWRFLRRRLCRLALPAVMVAGACILVSTTFVRGDSAEEFCLPFAMASLCLADGAWRKEDACLPRGCLFACGFFTGIIGMVKFTLLGIPAGLCIVEGVLALRQGGLLRALRSAGVFLAGMFIPVVGAMAYFAANGALSDFLTDYIYNNIFLYAGAGRMTTADWLAFLKGSGWWALPTVAGLVAFLADRRERPAVRAVFILGFFVQFAAVVLPGRVWQYSLMALAPFVMLGALEFGCFMEWLLFRKADGTSAVSRLTGGLGAAGCVFSLLLCLVVTPNAFLRGVDIRDTAQGRMASFIPKGADCLQYCFLDDGLYLVTESIPTEKYFVLLNVDLAEMREELDRYVREGIPEYVLSTYRTLPEDISGKYDLIHTDVGYLDNNKPNKEFYLYRRLDLP